MTTLHTRGSGAPARLPSFLPTGRPLAPDAFDLRHRGLLVVLWLHAPALGAFAVLRGYGLTHALLEAALIVGCAVVATVPRSRRVRAVAVALGLVLSSAVLVHLWEGAIEGHFHFFVVMTLLALYQSWLPFLAALVFVVLQHGVVGAVSASSVYAHDGGTDHPWRWALIHGAFLGASCAGNLLAWRLTEHEALHDSLTGLANRVLLLDVLHARFATGHGAAVLFLDLDDFKAANDGFGHEVGDELLMAVATRLSEQLRHGDLLARLGGDEFAVALADDDPAAAQAVAERVLGAFDDPFLLRGLSIVASASVGAAVSGPQSTPVSLLRDADLAMYAAKRAGGSRCATFDPAMHHAATQRSALIGDFPRALREQELVVHYQPVFRMSDDAVTGMEALVRWEHPTRGLVAPAEFVEAAEQSGFIVPLGAHVLRVACEQAVRWHKAFPDQPPMRMSVNLSPRQLAEPDLVAAVTAVLAETGLPPELLCLEVTETAVISDLADTVATLRALSAAGIRLALDDFGTGYSSLAYLQRMPVHVLKIDRSFVAPLVGDPAAVPIVRAVVQLAHQIGLSVTAEGIETAEQLELLRAVGCDSGQGFLRARPAPAEQVSAWLAAQALRPRQHDEVEQARSAG